MAEQIVNKVAASGLVQLDLEQYYPKDEIVVFDIKPYLFMELILKEKDFRERLQQVDWLAYREKIVAVTCTADAIIPMWAYMLIGSALQPVAREVVYGDRQDALRQAFLREIDKIDMEQFTGQRVVIKGCGELDVAPYAYLEITSRLRPYARSIMYGEPCSTVPVFKKKQD